jgi:hypothetical protein
MKIARYTGMGLALLLVVAGLLHQNVQGFQNDRTLLYIAVIFAVIHLGVFGARLGRPEPLTDGEPANPLEKRF